MASYPETDLHKILSATYRSVHDNTPLYLSDLLQKHNSSRLLRSASRSLLDVPQPRDSKTKRYGQRAFRYVTPSLWNVLPDSIKEKDSIQSFRPLLKTHFFAYTVATLGIRRVHKRCLNGTINICKSRLEVHLLSTL